MDNEIILFPSLAHACKTLPNLEIKSIAVNKKQYGIVRVNEEVFVFEKQCPHADYDLTQGKVSPIGAIICPWHNYQFMLKNGEERELRCKSLVINKAYFKDGVGICCELLSS